MDQFLLVLVAALTVAAVVFGVTVLVTGNDPGLVPVEPDGRAVPLPGTRPLLEHDVSQVRFDTALRGYRMAQVDQALRRAAYDIGYKDELIEVLQAEVAALREGRTEDADQLRRARDAALVPAVDLAGTPVAGTSATESGPADATESGPADGAESGPVNATESGPADGAESAPSPTADAAAGPEVRPADGAAR
ncbi:DivIVA domain-containing protein [Solwaraspora sp. WMMD937]|uniref:DivIVA domain-containing protein n=1 Tax=Solwaraspora sp. WMMD937 TaxID=3016090 RepID=UPI00249B404B|nr:DivIVA domain-containing protein [Solwaraspora sp. WMMD937]WFE22032.1 DivIVA domain-containing protein [Solwaraspora sp. WMMD937]